jgi:hypothetical protein
MCDIPSIQKETPERGVYGYIGVANGNDYCSLGLEEDDMDYLSS